jgi:hypothetical protein
MGCGANSSCGSNVDSSLEERVCGGLVWVKIKRSSLGRGMK